MPSGSSVKIKVKTKPSIRQTLRPSEAEPRHPEPAPLLPKPAAEHRAAEHRASAPGRGPGTRTQVCAPALELTQLETGSLLRPRRLHQGGRGVELIIPLHRRGRRHQRQVVAGSHRQRVRARCPACGAGHGPTALEAWRCPGAGGRLLGPRGLLFESPPTFTHPLQSRVPARPGGPPSWTPGAGATDARSRVWRHNQVPFSWGNRYIY